MMKFIYSRWLRLRLGICVVFCMLFGVNVFFPVILRAKVKHHKLRHNVRHHSNISKWLSKTPITFSHSESKYFDEQDFSDCSNMVIWERPSTHSFSELILSWNALRPSHGSMVFWLNIKYGNTWSGWQRMAEWGNNIQRSFINKINPYVHTKHVRVEMQHGTMAHGFKVKVTSKNGAPLEGLKALFACLSDLKQFKLVRPVALLPTTVIHGVPKQSQMVLNHPRFRDLCSPTSTSIIVRYFNSHVYGRSFNNFITNFAEKVYDGGKLNIYGNWQLNVAQAFDSLMGDVFFKVERLNGFQNLYSYLAQNIPVAVSVRRLPGGATPYSHGHFMVVIGWNEKDQRVICIDPAFDESNSTLKSYKLWDFLTAWGRSVNLSYIAIPKNLI